MIHQIRIIHVGIERRTLGFPKSGEKMKLSKIGHCVDKEKKILHFGIFVLFRFPGYEMWTPICFLLAVIVLSTMTDTS